MGDEFNKYDEPENNFKLNDMIAASEIDPDDDKVVDKTAPKYYYTKILGDKLNNLKEEDIDVVEVDENKPMNEIQKDVYNKLKRPKKDKNDGVQLVKTVGKPDKKDIVKFIIDNCKKDVPLTINYMKIKGSKWSKPKDSINYIKVSGDALAKPGETPSKDGKKPEVYFKVPDDKDLDEALDQIKQGGDLLNRPAPGDKFQKVTGPELNDVKNYFDDKEKGHMRPTGSLDLPEDDAEQESGNDDKFKGGDVDDECVITKNVGDGVERV